jgi:hypothetical protein
MTTPLSTAKMRVERNNETTTNNAHSFISTVLSVGLFNQCNMFDLIITCKLKEDSKEPELLEVTEEWLEENIQDMDHSIFDIEGYTKEEQFINESGSIGFGEQSFYDDKGDTLDEDTVEYRAMYLENQIMVLGYYLMLIDLQGKDELEKIGVLSFDINDGSQFGYNKKKEFAERDLAEFQKELENIQPFL